VSSFAPFAVTAGWGLDRLLGEPPTPVHPVALFGSVMTKLEQRLYGDDRGRGVAYTAVGVGVGATVGVVARTSMGPAASTMLMSWLAMAGTMLESESRRVAEALDEGDLVEARQRVGMLVGRRTDELDESGIARAVIESLAENTTDAVTATMFWAAIGGAPGAACHRCINTMDAMVGHHNERFERFGWASARLDDVANWLPARLSTLAVLLARPQRAVAVVRTIRRDAAQHPSPNGGLVEAAFAAALGLQLGGVNHYGNSVDDRGQLGDGRQPASADIERAAVLAQHVAVAALAMTAAAQVGSGLLVRCWVRRQRR
jgi:adenosylcobinamide-phosphate synthase